MSMDRIEEVTKAFARQRLEVITRADALQAELDAVHAKHAPGLRGNVESLLAIQAVLERELDQNAALFPDGAKSVVIDGIKVGFQKGKATVQLPENHDRALQVLGDLESSALFSGNAEAAARLAAAYASTTKLVATGVAKLTEAELQAIGAKLVPGTDCVLIKPVDAEAEKAVQALIKQVMAATEDSPAAAT